MKNVFKGDRCCSCYTCLPQTAPAAQTAQKMAALGTGTGAPQMDQRLLTNTWPKNNTQHKHISKQVQTLRNSTIIHKNSNKTKLKLFYTLQRSRGHKEHLKRSWNVKSRAKTRSRGLTVRKTEFLGVFCKNQGLKCN